MFIDFASVLTDGGDCDVDASSTAEPVVVTSPLVFVVDDSTLPLLEFVADVSGFEELK